MLITLLDHAVRPTLRAAAAIMSPAIAESNWPRGTCPACGAPPLLAELRAPSSGGERERFLRCGRCATAWPHARVRCAGCGTTDHRALRYMHVDGEEEFRRAMTCDSCQSYVKEIAVLDPLTADALLEEDLATVGLDLVATERGYRRAGTDP
jgi:FdhE protein